MTPPSTCRVERKLAELERLHDERLAQLEADLQQLAANPKIIVAFDPGGRADDSSAIAPPHLDGPLTPQPVGCSWCSFVHPLGKVGVDCNRSLPPDGRRCVGQHRRLGLGDLSALFDEIEHIANLARPSGDDLNRLQDLVACVRSVMRVPLSDPGLARSQADAAAAEAVCRGPIAPGQFDLTVTTASGTQTTRIVLGNLGDAELGWHVRRQLEVTDPDGLAEVAPDLSAADLEGRIVTPPTRPANGSVSTDRLTMIAAQAVDKVLNANGHRGEIRGGIRLRIAKAMLDALGLDRDVRTDPPNWDEIRFDAPEDEELVR